MESNTFSATTPSSMSPPAFRSHLSQRSRYQCTGSMVGDGSTVARGRIMNARFVATINDNRRWNDHDKYQPLSKRGITPILRSVMGFQFIVYHSNVLCLSVLYAAQYAMTYQCCSESREHCCTSRRTFALLGGGNVDSRSRGHPACQIGIRIRTAMDYTTSALVTPLSIRPGNELSSHDTTLLQHGHGTKGQNPKVEASPRSR
jgi:hypothetical protein